jgi:hypothetical protein
MYLRILPFIGLSIGLLSCGEGKRFTDGGDGDAGGLEGGEDGGDEADADADADDDDDNDDNEDDPDVEETDPAIVLGTVTVELYIEDDDGERIPYSWDEAVGEGGEFPFGSIFVSAYKSDDAGMERYFDQYTVTRPQIEGDHYLLEVDPNDTSMTNIYASLDIRSDGVISSAEPIGVYPDDIIVSEGTEAGDVNIDIMVDWGRWGPGGWGWSDGGAGGSGCDTLVSVDGPVSITVPYGGGNGMAMLLNTRGDGPYKFDTFTPIATPDGAEADYQMGMCPEAGDYQLVGAYDSNGNGLVDPSDLWGAYVTTEGDEGNPITVGNVNLSPYTLEIPIGAGESPLNVVPFVRLSGTITAPEGSALSGMGADGVAPSLYMAAMKYRMNTEFPVGALESSAYEYMAWGPDDLGEAESVEWELVVPANSVVYLWAYMDSDGDDMVNEIYEPVASSGSGSAGAFSTGEASQSDIDLTMRVVE